MGRPVGHGCAADCSLPPEENYLLPGGLAEVRLGTWDLSEGAVAKLRVNRDFPVYSLHKNVTKDFFIVAPENLISILHSTLRIGTKVYIRPPFSMVLAISQHSQQ